MNFRLTRSLLKTTDLNVKSVLPNYGNFIFPQKFSTLSYKKYNNVTNINNPSLSLLSRSFSSNIFNGKSTQKTSLFQHSSQLVTKITFRNKSIAMYSNKASLEAAAETLHQQQIKVQNQKESEKKTKRSLKELVLKYGATAVAVYIVLSSIAFVALLVVVKMQQLTPVEIENFVVKMLSYLPSFGNEGEQEEEKKGSYILHFFEGYNISESQAQKITDVAVAVVLTDLISPLILAICILITPRAAARWKNFKRS